jgi:putative nucleotidyltransferase with HDIG domain
MRTRIAIDQLKIGMKVEKLDRSWLVTPFLRNKFTVTSAQQIEQLIAIGVKELDVTIEEASQEGSSSLAGSDPGSQPVLKAVPQAALGKGPKKVVPDRGPQAVSGKESKAVPSAGPQAAAGQAPTRVSDNAPQSPPGSGPRPASDAEPQAVSGKGPKFVSDEAPRPPSGHRLKLVSDTGPRAASAKNPKLLPSEMIQPVSPSASKPESPVTTFHEELHEAKQAYCAAKGVIQQAMEDVRMGGALNMEAVQQVVEGMADSILRNPDALTSLSRLKQFDEYTFYHSVNTSLLALSLGRDLGYERPQLLQLGTGMLLHDIGKTQIPIELLNKPGRFEEHEFEMMKQHVMRGAELLSSTTGLSDEFLKPALEHHERVDGTGYPCQHCKADLSEFGLIAAVVDIYDAVTSDRCYHKAKSPHDTLQFLYQLGTRGHVDSALVQRLVQVVGVYPVGSCVALNTGEAAIVLQSNHEFPLKPRVRIVTDGTGFRRARPMDLDLSAQAGSLDRTIQAPVDPATMGVDPQSYLDHDAA